jgi:uncharacterized protein (DUF488 family)
VRDPGDHLPAAGGDGLAASTIYTVGHSTRSIDELISVLRSAGVRSLVDVRSVPRSARHPQFVREALTESLPGAGIEYRHEPALGGFRRLRADSVNGGWEHPAFRGYADYMQTASFKEALSALEGLARGRATSVMCAEAQWWRCHRRLISDALIVRGWRVLHLGLQAEPVEHALTPFAVVGSDGGLTYPPPQGTLL